MNHKPVGAALPRTRSTRSWRRPSLVPLRRLAIAIPAKDEAAGIAQVIASVPRAALDAMELDYEVVVIDGNSSDGTAEAAAAAGATVVRAAGQGKGVDVRRKMPRLEADMVVMLDGDGTYPMHDVPRFVQLLQDGADVVMGSRLREPGRMAAGAMSRTNRVGNWGLSILASILYRHRTTDLCTGMWGFRKEALAALPLNSNHFELEAELFAQSVKAGHRIVEIPIDYDVRHGHSKLGGVRTGMKIAAKLLRKRVVR